MSQEFMDPELFSDFIIEAKEHLETIEPNLLELEKVPGNIDLLNDIFRPMHSLKGASGFLGLNRINRLAHKAENILDELRKGSMVITSEIMDVILLATDALRQMIDNLEVTSSEGDVAIEPIGDLIDAIMSGNHPATQAVPVNVPEERTDSGESTEDAPDEEGMSQRDWVLSLEPLPAYPLTAFGEGHLKDFIDEAREITESLTAGLLDIERKGDSDPELVNDLFRYFHNLKGNSGIIGFQELNSLTHEAETLLNRVRHGEMPVTAALVDLLLLVVDATDCLVERIEPATGKAQPFQIADILFHLQQAVAGGEITLPDALRARQNALLDAAALRTASSDDTVEEQPTGQPEDEATPPTVEETKTSSAAEQADPPVDAPHSDIVAIHPVGTRPDEDDISVFSVTVQQQQAIIRVALDTLEKDGSQKEYVDALYRCLVAIQNASGFMKLEPLRVYAERTASLVNQARSSGMDFSLMVDLLNQEVSIIGDMVAKEVGNLRTAAAVPETPQAAASVETPVPPAASADAEPAVSKTGKSGKTAKSAKTSPEEKTTTATKPTLAASAAVKPAAPIESVAPVVPVAPVAPVAQASVTPPKTATPQEKPVSTPDPVLNRAPKIPVVPVSPVSPVPVVSSASTSPSTSPVPRPATPATTPAAAPAATAAEHKASSTIRVDHEKLDHLMNLIGELIINRNRYTMLARRLEDNSVTIDIGEIAQDLSETTYAMARISDELQATIMKVRMVPVASVFSRFPRLVRDLSRKSGKEVDLILEGEETELDKSVVEVIGDPLVHLIRNSVDHGIEPEAERLALGKPAKGRVVLRAFHKGNSVAIEIEDDGKGLDPEKLREVAVRKGLMTADEAKLLDDREAKELIFAPGFSSAEKITDISGRGVGMDVVRTNIKNLKGSININSEVGKGTRFTLNLPLTLAIIDALMINVAGETYAIPLDAVSETTKIEATRLTDVKGRKAVTLRGEVLGIMELSDMIGLPRKELPEVLSVVVIHDNERRLGLVVDRLLERQEIVIKPLGSYLGDVRGISGATIMGDGSVILILDPHEIYTMATSNRN